MFLIKCSIPNKWVFGTVNLLKLFKFFLNMYVKISIYRIFHPWFLERFADYHFTTLECPDSRDL